MYYPNWRYLVFSSSSSSIINQHNQLMSWLMLHSYLLDFWDNISMLFKFISMMLFFCNISHLSCSWWCYIDTIYLWLICMTSSSYKFRDSLYYFMFLQHSPLWFPIEWPSSPGPANSLSSGWLSTTKCHWFIELGPHFVLSMDSTAELVPNFGLSYDHKLLIS